MPFELNENHLELIRWGLMIGVPSFFAGWFAHVLCDALFWAGKEH